MTSLSLFLISATTQARPMDGSCALHDFSRVMIDKDGTLDTSQGVWVLRYDAPVYPTIDGSDSSSTEKFGEYLLPVKVAKHPDTGVQRLQVKKFGTGTQVGWMEGYDLLCGVSPLQSEKGLDRKVFVKTPTSHDPRLSTVPAYPSYEGPCNDDCEQFSRFELYFIFAEDKLHRRYFILKAHTLKKDKPFSSLPSPMGWVKYDNTIPWDTTIGLRPKEEVDKLSAYKQPEDINNPDKKTGVEVAGGNIWYTYPIHIPILDINKEQNYYHAVAPGIGVGLYEGVLSNLKLVDVFFLLDGTASMGPYIKAAGQAVQNIAENLRNEQKFQETSFRFAFRVYRDTYADSTLKECYEGVCEGMPFSAETCSFDQEATKANWADFKDKIDDVKETRDDNDDYPENLFEGLRQALFDMASCPKRTKLLFVIGDHGDRQQQWPKDIVDGLKGLADRVIVFFIQTPNNSSQVRNPQLYQQAYRAYKDQADELLKKILPPEFQSEGIDDYFLSLDQTQLAAQIVDGVKRYSPSDVINEFEQALAGGKSLQEVIDQYMAEGDMPIVYKKWLEDTACPKLGQQCENPIEHGVVDFYIPIDDTEIQEEVWMTAVHLNDWLSLLKAFEDIRALPVRTQREIFVMLLRKQIQDIIGGYPPSNIVLSEWLAKQRRQVLPMRQDSPLLQYSFDDIRRKLEVCEVSLLVNWVAEIRKVLQKVSNDSTQKVAFTPKYPTSVSCPLSDKGQKVPELLEFEDSEPLGPDDNYRYDHHLYGQTVYWLPIDFLP
jgi:hypothetical protein